MRERNLLFEQKTCFAGFCSGGETSVVLRGVVVERKRLRGGTTGEDFLFWDIHGLRGKTSCCGTGTSMGYGGRLLVVGCPRSLPP